MKIHWRDDGYYDGVGKVLGYRVTQNEIRSGLLRLGVRMEDEADLCMQICSPPVYEAVPGKKNVIYTMIEHPRIKPEYVARLNRADLVLVPSLWVKDVFVDSGVRNVEIVPLGLHAAQYPFVKRQLTKPFRYLWLGAPNQRKGWKILQTCWQVAFARFGEFELYIKTSGTDAGEGVERVGNIIVDSRYVSQEELHKIYADAHCFVFPTTGEGFGLSLLEAMSTGLPCITTRYSGLLDFTSTDTVHYLAYVEMPAITEYGERVVCGHPVHEDVVRAMIHVFHNYDESIAMGRRASRVARTFTWDNTCRELLAKLHAL